MRRVNHVLATVEFPISAPLDDLAASLGAVTQGLKFVFDDTGRFDEVPAYIAEKDGARFTLFGTPEGEAGESYVLEFSFETPHSMEELRHTYRMFGDDFFVDKEMNGRGYFDYSKELAEHLRKVGFDTCKAL